MATSTMRVPLLWAALAAIVISAALYWETVAEEAGGDYHSRIHHENFNVLSMVGVWGLAYVVVSTNLPTGLKTAALVYALVIVFFLVSGVGTSFYSMPLMSLGSINMIRKWVALPHGWDSTKDLTPAWARKYFAAGILGWVGLGLSLLVMLEFEKPKDRMNRSRSRRLGNYKLLAGATACISAIISCACFWTTVMATPPSGDFYLANGPLYYPTVVEQYRESIYGNYAAGNKGVSDGDAYFEIMSSSGVAIMFIPFTLILLTSANNELAGVLLGISALFGWNMFGRMFFWRWQMDGAISGEDRATMTAAYIFAWIAGIGVAACAALELLLQMQAPFKLSSVLPDTGKLPALVRSKGSLDQVQSDGANTGVQRTVSHNLDHEHDPFATVA